MLSDQDLTALLVTLKLASVSTLVLLIIGTPLAWWLSRSQWRYKYFIEAIIALPLILPPTVLGFYLLISLGPNGPIGGLVNALGGPPLAFSFTGLVIGSVFYSMPFVVQPLQNAFASIGNRPLEVAATLRASPLDRFLTIAVPMAKPGFITASVLGFAHTLGEFGVVLMIGGNIPGSTQVASIAIYDHVEALEYGQAHWLAGSLLLFSFLLLIIVYGANRRYTVAQS
ncbi:molybdate ABC transporter permease subunit [Gammaproteobacteria bacterium]|nr:molybdate ABC transporter permease subunit [Gammaproteobacteria bacterium]